MNKKMIFLGISAAALASPVAHADTSSVQLIGRIQAEYQSTRIDDLAGNRRQNSIADNANQSRFGMRINEDLGNGLSAIAFIDWRFGTGAGTGPIAREQWVGLGGNNWGNVVFGRINSPFKTYGGSAYDLLYNTSLQLMGSGGAMYAPASGWGVDGFVDHSARFESPKWGIFQFAALLAGNNADQADALNGGGNTGGRGNGVDFQIAARADFGMGEVVAGYSRDNANDAQRAIVTNGKNGDAERVWMLGGRVKFGDAAIFAQYFNVRDALAQGGGGGTGVVGSGIGAIASAGCGAGGASAGNGDVGVTTVQCNTAMNTNGDGNIWSLGFNYKLGNNTFVLQGGRTKADAIGTAPNRRANDVTIGAIHAFSKRTTVFGGYQRVNVDNGSGVSDPDRKTLSLGMRHNF